MNYFPRCHWRIRNDDEKLLTLSFERMNVEDDPSCAYDNLIIENEFSGYHEKLCGSDLPEDITVHGNGDLIRTIIL